VLRMCVYVQLHVSVWVGVYQTTLMNLYVQMSLCVCVQGCVYRCRGAFRMSLCPYLPSGMSPAKRFSLLASRLVGGTDLTSTAPVMAGTSGHTYTHTEKGFQFSVSWCF